jgi:hypothetical protein
MHLRRHLLLLFHRSLMQNRRPRPLRQLNNQQKWVKLMELFQRLKRQYC